MGAGERDSGIDEGLVRAALKSQYHAGLAMLRDAVERCPDELWTSRDPINAFWQVAYHALYYTHLYLQPNEEAFRPWREHQAEVQHADGLTGPRDSQSPLPLTPRPYTRAQVLAYCRDLHAMIDETMDGLDLTSLESGFWWYQMSKLEHQILNVRHLHHHVAQLADRVRASTGAGVDWISAASAPDPDQA